MGDLARESGLVTRHVGVVEAGRVVGVAHVNVEHHLPQMRAGSDPDIFFVKSFLLKVFAGAKTFLFTGCSPMNRTKVSTLRSP